jgi:hypothetical protein
MCAIYQIQGRGPKNAAKPTHTEIKRKANRGKEALKSIPSIPEI